jgi:hypothetical protein
VNGGTETPLPDRPQLDSVDRRVRSLFYREFDRAYPRRPSRDGENACPVCRGDGCEACGWTGEASEVTGGE